MSYTSAAMNPSALFHADDVMLVKSLGRHQVQGYRFLGMNETSRAMSRFDQPMFRNPSEGTFAARGWA